MKYVQMQYEREDGTIEVRQKLQYTEKEKCAYTQYEKFKKNEKDFLEMDVYAHLIEEPMDPSEMEEAGLLMMLEMYTPDNIEKSYEYFINSECSDKDFQPISRIFTVNKPNAAVRFDVTHLETIKKQCCDNKGWIKGKLIADVFQRENAVHGKVSYSKGGVHFEYDATFFSESAGPDDIKNIENASAISEGAIQDLPDKLPEMPDLKKSCTSSKKPYKVTIYKVGNANTITIEKGEKCILFDCGTKGAHPDTENYIKEHVKPDIIIISHRHEDHILLLNEQKIDTSKLKMIIFPDDEYKKKPSVTLNEKLGKLQRDEHVQLIQLNRLSDGFKPGFLSKYGFDNIDLYIGNNKKPNTGEYGEIEYDRTTDDTGIILSIKSYENGSSPIAILPGDCSYYSWPKELQESLSKTQYLVVPHHGGHIIITDAPGEEYKGNADIYVSTGRGQFDNMDNEKGKTKHFDFIKKVFKNHEVHMTSNPTGDPFFDFEI